MTYVSSALLGFADEPTEAELEKGNPDARVLCRIEGVGGFSPYDLVDWARERGLAVAYVDGAWVRVAADREAIRSFLAGRIDVEDLDRVLKASAERKERLVLEAEEF